MANATSALSPPYDTLETESTQKKDTTTLETESTQKKYTTTLETESTKKKDTTTLETESTQEKDNTTLETESTQEKDNATLETESTLKKDTTVPETEINSRRENDVVDPQTGVGTTFEDDNTRIVFIIKVLAVVLMQVMATGFIILLAIFTYMRQSWFVHKNWKHLIVVAPLPHLFTYFALFYCTEARKQNPYNYMFLTALPLTTGFTIVVFTCHCILEEIGFAWIMYTIAVIGQLVYSIFCLDGFVKFRVKTGIYITAGILILFYAYVALLRVYFYIDSFTLFCLTLLVFVECSLLTYRLFLMTSKECRCVLAPSDYVNGALCIHTDTIYNLQNLCSKLGDCLLHI